MAQNVQPNKGEAVQPKAAPPVAVPAATAAKPTKTEVAVRSIKWSDVEGFHGKQYSETQADSFGTLFKHIAITKGSGDDLKVVGVTQDGGKPVKGVLPNLQRELLKLCGVLWFTNPSAIKCRGYIRTAARYGKEISAIIEGLTKEGYELDMIYGSKNTRLHAIPAVLGQFIMAEIQLERATTVRWPSEDQDEEPAEDEAVTEEVTLTL